MTSLTICTFYIPPYANQSYMLKPCATILVWAEATRLSYKAYARRKWRNRLLRLVLWGAVLALAIAILVMVGS